MALVDPPSVTISICKACHLRCFVQEREMVNLHRNKAFKEEEEMPAALDDLVVAGRELATTSSPGHGGAEGSRRGEEKDGDDPRALPQLHEEHSFRLEASEDHEHERRRMVNALSQEEMLALLPDTNHAYNFGREGSKDKFKTIGLGGARVSTDKLQLEGGHHDSAVAQVHGADMSSSAPKAVHEGGGHHPPGPCAMATPIGSSDKKDRAPHLVKASSSSGPAPVDSPQTPHPLSSLLLFLKEHFFWVVSIVDDAVLACTGPLYAYVTAVVHKLPMATNTVDFEKDLRMPLKRSPGESLAYMFIHPRNNMQRKYPTILVRNPYGRTTFFYPLYPLAERGFNVIVQDVRGRGESTGVFDCITDHQDSLDTLEWIQSQPWYSHKHGIGMMGLSFNGFVLWSTLKKGTIPHCIKAIVPMNTTSRLSSINWRDGPLHLELVIRWTGYLWTITRGGSTLFGLVWRLLCGLEFLGCCGLFDFPSFKKGIYHLPVEDIIYSIKGVRLNRWHLFLSPPHTEFTKLRSAEGGLRADTPPAQIHVSWYDIFLIDSLYDFTTLVEKGNKEARLVVTNHSHLARYFTYGDLVKHAIAHFKRYCRPDKQPYTTTDDRIRIQVLQSTNEWINLSSWPPANVPTTAIFSADGRLCWDKDGGQVVKGGRRYVYKPADPTPTIGGNGIGFLDAGGRDQARLERRDGQDLLVYTSDILEEDMVLVGYPKFSLWLRCHSVGAINADFVARVCDVLPSGKSINICDGVKRLSFGDLDRDDRGAFRVDFNTYPTAVRFRRGHRIRVHVASAGFWRWERNIMGYGYESLIPVHFELLHGPNEEGSYSHVVLPVFPAQPLGAQTRSRQPPSPSSSF